MDQKLQGALCRPPSYSCQPVKYRSSGLGSIPLEEGTELLQAALANQPGPVVVLAYSQGGMIATTWLNRYGNQVDRRDEIILVLLGSPQHGLGGYGPMNGSKKRPATPTDTGYTVIEVTREYDMESDFPLRKGNWLALSNAFSGFFRVHTDYASVDLLDPDNLVKQIGGTTYVLIPTAHLPMLEPLRRLGLVTLADSLETRWRPIVDSAYDRSGYVTLAEAWRDGMALPDILSAAALPQAASTDLVSRAVTTVTVPLDSTAAETARALESAGQRGWSHELGSTAAGYEAPAGDEPGPALDADAGPEADEQAVAGDGDLGEYPENSQGGALDDGALDDGALDDGALVGGFVNDGGDDESTDKSPVGVGFGSVGSGGAADGAGAVSSSRTAIRIPNRHDRCRGGDPNSPGRRVNRLTAGYVKRYIRARAGRHRR